MEWIFRYLRGTSKAFLCYGNDRPLLVGYTDADITGNLITRSISGFVITFVGGVVS